MILSVIQVKTNCSILINFPIKDRLEIYRLEVVFGSGDSFLSRLMQNQCPDGIVQHPTFVVHLLHQTAPQTLGRITSLSCPRCSHASLAAPASPHHRPRPSLRRLSRTTLVPGRGLVGVSMPRYSLPRCRSRLPRCFAARPSSFP